MMVTIMYMLANRLFIEIKFFNSIAYKYNYYILFMYISLLKLINTQNMFIPEPPGQKLGFSFGSCTETRKIS